MDFFDRAGDHLFQDKLRQETSCNSLRKIEEVELVLSVERSHGETIRQSVYTLAKIKALSRSSTVTPDVQG